MTKKGRIGDANVARGLKKNNIKPVPQAGAGSIGLAAAARSTKVGLSKGGSGSFLKDRQNKKVRDLRCGSALSELATQGQSLSELTTEAAERAEEYQEELDSWEPVDEFEANCFVNPNREAENNRKKYYTELRKVIANADVIIEVLDARDPGSCRNVQLEKDVLAAGKKLVLLINKIDLVPKEAVVAWRKHLQRSFPTCTFKAARSGTHRPTHAQTSAENAPEGLLRSTHGVVGADEVMQLLKNYARMKDAKVKCHITAGIVGYPNTGKSSVINSMKRHNSVQVGGRAGVTTVMQEVPLDSKVTLIDSPGVVFEGSSEDPGVVLRNVVSVDKLQDPIGVVTALIAKTPREALLDFYGADHDFSTPDEFLIHVAKSRGKIVRGSALDINSAAKSVIQDWTTGRFRYFVMPPVVAEEVATLEDETANVVSGLAPALNIDAMFDGDEEAMDELDIPEPAVLGAPVVPDSDDDSMDCEDGGGLVGVDN